MKSIILAAGRGWRIKELTEDINKCSLEVAGKPIIRRLVDVFKKNNLETHIVTGHVPESIKSSIKEDASYIHNPNYSSAGILASLLCAKERVENESFVLSTGDNLFDPKIFPGFLNAEGEVVVAVKKKKCNEEVMKVIVEDGRITRLGQDISPEKATGEFGMMIKLNSENSKKLFESAEKILDKGRAYAFLIDALNMMIEQGVELVPYYYEKGIEVDTLEDLKEAESVVRDFED